MCFKLNQFRYEINDGFDFDYLINNIESGKIVGYAEDFLLIIGENGDYFLEDINTHKRLGPYFYASKFTNGLARITEMDKNNKRKYYFIDKTGKKVFKTFKFPVSEFSNGYSKVDHTKFMDTNGNIYDYRKKDPLACIVSNFVNGVATVDRYFSKEEYYIDSNFNKITKEEYEYALQNFYIEEKEDKKYYVDKKTGTKIEITDLEYKVFGDLHDGYVEIAYSDNTYSYALLTKEGNVFDFYDHIKLCDDYIIVGDNGYIKLSDFTKELSDKNNWGYFVNIYNTVNEEAIKYFDDLKQVNEYTKLLDNKITELKQYEDFTVENIIIEEEFFKLVDDNYFVGPRQKTLKKNKRR